MRFYNPFRKIRELEDALLASQVEAEHWMQEARYARKDAMRDALEHFERRTHHLRAQNEHLLKNAMDIMAATPQAVYFRKEQLGEEN